MQRKILQLCLLENRTIRAMTDNESTQKEFSELVNMSAKELEQWLQSDESQSVGIKKGTSSDKKTSAKGSESTGHESGRGIITILQKKKVDLDDDDFDHMRYVNGYIKRHLAQKPKKEAIETSRWRYSLMNWGHDPLK